MDNQYGRSSTNYSRASSVQPPFSYSNLHLKVEPKPKYFVNTAVIDSVVTDLKYEKVDGSKNVYSKIKKSRFNWQLNEFDKTGY